MQDCVQKYAKKILLLATLMVAFKASSSVECRSIAYNDEPMIIIPF